MPRKSLTAPVLDVPRCIADGIHKSLATSHLVPLSSVFADVLARQTSRRRQRGAHISFVAFSSLRQQCLYFLLVNEFHAVPVDSDDGQDATSSCTVEYARDPDDQSKDLWSTLDSTLNLKWDELNEHRLHKRAMEHEEDELWHEFWEYYRANGAKTTRAEVAGMRSAGGCRLASQGCMPTLSQRILQEYNLLEKYDRPNTNLASSTIPRHTPETPSKPKTPRTPRTARTPGTSMTPSTPGSRGTSQRKRRSTREAEDYEKWGFSTESYRGEDNNSNSKTRARQSMAAMPSPRGLDSVREHAKETNEASDRRGALRPSRGILPNMFMSEGNARSRNINSFKSWEDYKLRQRAVRNSKLDEANKEMVSMATARPQVQASVALREHRNATEWRMRGEVVHPSGAMSARAGFFQLPEIVANRSNGFEAARNNMNVPALCFHRPWSREESFLRKRAGSEAHRNAIERFAKVCVNTGVHPQPSSIRYLVKLLPKIDVRGKGYADEDVLALAAALPSEILSSRLECVDLGDNPRLTNQAACTMLRALAHRYNNTLNIIKLDHCRRLGKETTLTCTQLLRDSFQQLQTLDLSGIVIGLLEYTEFAQAVQQHARLKELRLAETSLGLHDKMHASRVISVLMGNSNLEVLDLGWNSLDTWSFETLGKGLVQHEKLASLGLANCGPVADPTVGGSPVLVFIEFLACDKTLTALDISNNALDQDAPLVLESAARRHPRLARIDMSRNPVGISGARALLRLMADPECHDLTSIAMQGRHAQSPSAIMRNAVYRRDGGEQAFNFKLLKQATGKSTVWEVPMEGTLEFELCAGLSILGDVDAKMPVATRVDQIVQQVRIMLPARREAVAVLGQIKSVQDEEERNHLLEALSRDFVLTPDQVRGLCKTKSRWANCGRDPVAVMKRLLPCIVGPASVRHFFQNMKTHSDMMRVVSASRNILALNLENPTGHYVLSLSEPSDRSTAERLLLLNRWEIHVWKAQGLPDISQHGNFKNFRNESYGNREFVWSAEEWRLPGSDLLRFDYVSLRRPPQGARPVDRGFWNRILHVLHSALFEDESALNWELETTLGTSSYVDIVSEGRAASRAQSRLGAASESIVCRAASVSDAASDGDTLSRATSRATSRASSVDKLSDDRSVAISDADIIWVLRSVSAKHWVSSLQIRQLLCLFCEPQQRQEALISLIFRCTDWPVNGKQCRPKFTREDWSAMENRIGYVCMFPFFQPENAAINMDLRQHDQRRALSMFIVLKRDEQPNNIGKPRIDWNGPSSSQNWETFVSGIPLSWDDVDNVPRVGLFNGVFNSSMDNVRLRVRRKMAATIGGWTNLPDDVGELARLVEWWIVLDDLPDEVVNWANFCVSQYPTLRDCFMACDTSGDGNLSLSEFIQGFQKLGFRLCPESKITAAVKTGIELERNRERRRGVFEQMRPTSEAGELTASSITAAMEKAKQKKSQSFVGYLSKEKGGEAVVKDPEKIVSTLTAVYRFMDPNSDGSISLAEFLSLEGMFRELRQTMWEFVEHLLLRFGTLDHAWEYADEDGSGELDSDEFELLARRWNFDGPTQQIYMYLNEDGSNSIGHDEWMKLGEIKNPHLS